MCEWRQDERRDSRGRGRDTHRYTVARLIDSFDVHGVRDIHTDRCNDEHIIL